MLNVLLATGIALITAPGLIFWGFVVADAVTGWRRWRARRRLRRELRRK